ncbi:bacteriophage integrase [Burkholderia pseudomallei]|uniref:tyrosine-type recombinase/integrase n=1 Tax=Burkholderia pseudomallei TaxID=28450 RepID=UPI000F08823D|nr:site-specific integrase [Burkholderia pseudomallei]MCD4553205.1 site-specific integrase [Burkholderia pseudomallei]VBC23775.1 bacteriophage integrase [Burkholderia pseudomallei]VBF37416.1 bacteriophage integrase [Burkholderia pseudomallei]
MTFEEIVSIYLSAKDHRSKQRDMYSLKRLQPYFGGRAISALKRVDVRKYVAVRLADGVQESTVKRELKFLSAAINFVRLECDCSDLPNPVQSLGLNGGEHRVRWISRAEASALILSAGAYAKRPHLANFVRLALSTGCRKNELLALDWRRVDFERSFLRLDAEHTKNGKRRVVPLNGAALSALRDQREWVERKCSDSEWVFPAWSGKRIQTLQKGFNAACARVGIENFRIHDLRHTFASWLVMEGVSLYVVKDLLGHSSISVTERYAHLSPDQGRAAVQKLLPL